MARITISGSAKVMLEVTAISMGIALIHFLVFGAQFFFNQLAPGGDTQTLWSFYYIAIYSVRHFGEFLWWDPTALNGWPAYYLTYFGWSNLMSPFQLAQLLFGEIIAAVFGLSINKTLLIQKTILVVVINIVGIVLISRELLKSRIARIFPPLVYALCHMQFLGYTAAGTVDALPAAIFLLYAVINYNNRRTPGSFGVLVLFAGTYLGSMNYLLLQSHVYALGFFLVLIPLLFPGLFTSIWDNCRSIGKSSVGLMCLVAGLFFMLSGALTFFAAVRANLPNFARLRSATIPYEIARENAFDPPGYAIASTEAWTNLFSWIPYSDFHAYSMKFDPFSAGLDYRYIGLATLPLILVALIRGVRNRYTWLFALSFFLCTAFVTYTWQNLPFSLLIEKSSLFKNIRTMAAVMPRDLVGLFPLFLAAIGLDILVARAAAYANEEQSSQRATHRAVTAGLLILALSALVCLFLLAIAPQLSEVRKSLGHIGIYLLLFSGLTLLLHSITDESTRHVIASVFVVLAVTDLTISASDQWINNNINGRYYHHVSAIHMKAEESGIGPLASEAGSWPGPNYSGMVHNMVHGGPYFGLKPWLALVTRPSWQPVLDTWNPLTRMVTKYPYFKFFTNGAFIPADSIRSIDAVQPPAIELPGRILETNQRSMIRFDGGVYPVATGNAGQVETAELSVAWKDRYWFSGWAVDERAGKPARLVFVFLGGQLLHVGSPTDARSDLARKPHDGGFGFNVPMLPQDALDKRISVRVFALMHDNTAKELAYGKDYPFSVKARPGVGQETPVVASESGQAPAFYVHDQALAEPGVTGRRIYNVDWQLIEFTLNRVKVRVKLAEAAHMVYLDNYDKFWRAYVNGERVPVYRANFTFKTIRLPAGESVVEWEYNPFRVKLAWAAYYMLFAVYVVTLWAWRRRRFDPIRSSGLLARTS